MHAAHSKEGAIEAPYFKRETNEDDADEAIAYAWVDLDEKA